ncbi:hypothetical protein L4X63_23475 [Geomonas sp. Red32]|uniref:hypothetical protein n=1 Tax=Geomonas sp. Red32 TaxID=2912856 RepID=UPI00202CCC05|nr:hypothetical protein [Geomonas sp. Red32]MCM0084539.1 hypothetical protein [Geomonas sp. Red32]
MPWIERNRPTFYSYASAFLSACGWSACLGGYFWAYFKVVNIAGTVIPNDTFVAAFFTLVGAAISAMGFLCGLVAFGLKVRSKVLIVSLALNGMLAIPIGVSLLIGSIKN